MPSTGSIDEPPPYWAVLLERRRRRQSQRPAGVQATPRSRAPPDRNSFLYSWSPAPHPILGLAGPRLNRCGFVASGGRRRLHKNTIGYPDQHLRRPTGSPQLNLKLFRKARVKCKELARKLDLPRPTLLQPRRVFLSVAGVASNDFGGGAK